LAEALLELDGRLVSEHRVQAARIVIGVEELADVAASDLYGS
jgi:hypothetical protein